METSNISIRFYFVKRQSQRNPIITQPHFWFIICHSYGLLLSIIFTLVLHYMDCLVLRPLSIIHTNVYYTLYIWNYGAFIERCCSIVHFYSTFSTLKERIIVWWIFFAKKILSNSSHKITIFRAKVFRKGKNTLDFFFEKKYGVFWWNSKPFYCFNNFFKVFWIWF